MPNRRGNGLTWSFWDVWDEASPDQDDKHEPEPQVIVNRLNSHTEHNLKSENPHDQA